MLVVNEKDLRSSISLTEAINVIEDGFTRLANGEVNLPPVMSLDLPEVKGEMHIKGAHIGGDESFVIKLATGFYDNPLIGLPSGAGMMLVFSARTGFPEALLLDNAYLTDLRTAAAGAVAAKYLAGKEPETVGVIGAGTQGRFQVRALAEVRKFQRVLVYDLDSARSASYAQEMPELLGVPVAAMNDPEPVVRESDVLITATPASRPIVQARWLRSGLHITAMGTDSPYKQELESEALARADLLVCDLKTQCFERGELHHGLKDGFIAESDPIVELGELTSGRHPGRTDEAEITICDLTGVGVQDAAIAGLAYQKALQGGLGSQLEA
ncbi:MAG: cyclodeaminase [Anaerolineae bacterium]|nr:cyclodeaminase [Anaerolineae bacterium]